MIRAYMMFQNVTQSEIARRCGVTRGLVCHVIAGRRKNEAVREAVADAIGIESDKLWGV